MIDKPKAQNSAAQQEIENVTTQLEKFEKNVKDLTLDRMASAPKLETEQQTKLSQKEIANSKDVYLKPDKVISSHGQKFNEKFREDWEFDKEYVQFIAENKEIIGETIDIWTRPYGGVPAEYWKVPTNKPVWGPRYLAEQIKRKYYHRLVMQQSKITSADGMGSYYGDMVADSTVQRLDAHPVSSKRSVFMGGSSF